jgi:hypothetical protein
MTNKKLAIRNLCISLFENELREANKEFPLFQSRHEAYGVMKEELEEVIEEIKDIEIGILEDYWKLCRNSKNKQHNDKNCNILLNCLESAIICSMKELIQLGAMVKKARLLENKEEKIK